MADGTFLFEGNIKLKFVVDEGITYLPVEDGEGQLKIDVTVGQDYYLVGSETSVTLDFEDVIQITMEENKEDFIVSKKTDADTSQDVTITITIGATKKRPSVTCAVEEKQVFRTVAGTEANISKDSAYTVGYTVRNFDAEAYKDPQLTFDSAVPVGTTIILQSRNGGKLSYWSYTAGAAVQSISLSSFKRMGGTDMFQAQNGDLNLQFVLDFSRAVGGGDVDKLKTSLDIAREEANNGAPELTAQTAVTVGLGTAGFTLSGQDGTGLTCMLTYSFAPDLAASRWDHRELALVVTCTQPLPLDAVLSANVGGVWRTVRPVGAGKYIIPLGDTLNGSIQLTLQSDMFPVGSMSYQMTCQLYASQSVADAAPLNGTPVGGAVDITFANTVTKIAVAVTEAAEKHLFSSSEDITVSVGGEFDDYTLKVQLEHKDRDTGEYVNTARRPDRNGNSYTFDLNDCVPDSYRIVAIVERDDGFALAQASYYFIIQ